jgi:hypothetical protein
LRILALEVVVLIRELGPVRGLFYLRRIMGKKPADDIIW